MNVPAKKGVRSGGWSYAIFVGTLLLRLINLVRLTSSPSLLPSRGDMHFYSGWALQILRGQPTDHLAFYGLPGYAYVLAFFYYLFGNNPFVPALIQCLLEAGTATIIYQLTVQLWPVAVDVSKGECSSPIGRKLVGSLAALGWIFFVPAEAYSVVLMPTSWFVFAFWLVVWRLSKPGGVRPAECFLLGLSIGLSATLVANILLLALLILARLLLTPRPSGQPLFLPFARGSLLVFAGIAIGTSPCWIHNFVIARDPVILSGHSGINFWIGNNPVANGYPRFPPGLHPGQAAMLQDSINQAEAAAGHPLKRAEVSAFWSSKAKEYIGSHPMDWVRLIGRKIRNFWSAFQYDDLSVITSLREQGVIFPGLYFGMVAALGIPGLLLAIWFAPRSRWIVGAVVLALLGLLTVFITERYRLVAVPGLLIGAVYGLWIFWKSLNDARLTRALVYLAALATATAFVSWPNRQSSLWALDAYNSGWQAIEAGDLPTAEKKLAVAYAYVPTNAETNFALGNLRLTEDRRSEAKSFFQITLRLDPHHKGALNNLGVISLEDGEFAGAQRDFERAIVEQPGDAKTHYLLAKALFAEGNLPAARAAIDRALSLNPNPHEFTELKATLEKASSQ